MKLFLFSSVGECGGSAQLDHCNICEGSNQCFGNNIIDTLFTPGIHTFIVPSSVTIIDSVLIVGGGGAGSYDESLAGRLNGSINPENCTYKID